MLLPLQWPFSLTIRTSRFSRAPTSLLGWSIIISDNLISNVLFLFSLIIGMLTGGVGLVLHQIEPSWFDVDGTEATSMSLAFL